MTLGSKPRTAESRTCTADRVGIGSAQVRRKVQVARGDGVCAVLAGAGGAVHDRRDDGQDQVPPLRDIEPPPTNYSRWVRKMVA